ncbi:AAA family ATPase [Actinoplanes sp. NPDC023936]|uniref:NACHT domain-containing protein n=1 Tax=Actinoplanes sp. NPDC023936 TaxID=3154910 RepID=UPI0033E1FCEA
MRREPSLTFSGALDILGAQDPSKYSRLSKVLGGVVLVSGVATAVATLGPAAAAPLAAVAPFWGWVDQKNEAMGLLRDLHAAFRKGLGTAPTRRRRELVAAAHTTVVVSSFFQVLREAVGERAYAALKITEREQLTVALGPHTGLLRALYEAEVPAPGPGQGFAATESAIRTWYHALAERTESFLQGLNAWHRAALDPDLDELAAEKYRENYVALAAAVPEFRIWASLDEHAATQYAISALTDELGHQHDGLARVEALLTLAATASTPVRQPEPQAVIARANRSQLDQRIINPAEARHLGPVVLPTVGNAFVAPSYRVTEMDPRTPVTDETWWQHQPRHDDLDVWLAGYALAPRATSLPLLLLGHPGAGKSMLMRVLAARLPVSDYTVTLVPLRAVSANATVVDQIQQALDRSTNRRVAWADLADTSVDTIRVIILDGLDELLQASQHDRSGFLQEVTDFQRVEAEQDRPAIVIVTSRTVVADRVDIPAGTTVLKLDDFDDQQIKRWLREWNETNAVPIAAGLVRGLSAEVALGQRELACQPLLLLILALYSADPQAEPLTGGISRTALYQNIIASFARREVLKEGTLADERLRTAVNAKIERLCVAAFAMFNRGRQNTMEIELSADLTALQGADPLDGEEPGQRLLGEFFFVHTAEATVLGAGDTSARRRERRSYEFLHATFGEYLVAYRILEELRDVADTAYSSRRERDPDDTQLATLLSHQPIAARASIVGFFLDLFADLDAREQGDVTRVLTFLARNYRVRAAPGASGSYRPTPPDLVRRLACYSANLVLLRVAVAESGTPLGDVATSAEEWASTVSLWKSGLAVDGWHAVLGVLDRRNDDLVVSTGTVSPPMADYRHACLIDDAAARARLKFGLIFVDDVWVDDDRDPGVALLAAICAFTAGRDGSGYFAAPPGEVGRGTAELIGNALERMMLGTQAGPELVDQCLRLIVELDLLHEIDSTAILLNLARYPSLLDDIPELQDVRRYRSTATGPILLRCLAHYEDDEFSPQFRRFKDDLAASSPHQAVIADSLPEAAADVIQQVTAALREDEGHFPEAAFGLRHSSYRLWSDFSAAIAHSPGQKR